MHRYQHSDRHQRHGTKAPGTHRCTATGVCTCTRTWTEDRTEDRTDRRGRHGTATGTEDVDGDAVPLVNFLQRDAAMYGVEGQIETKLVHRFVGGLMGDYVRAKIRDSDDNLPYIPAGRLGASLRYDNGRVSAGGDVRRVFAQDNVSGDDLDLTTDAYTLLDLSATWLFTVKSSQVHSLTLRVDNALDEQYRDATSRIKSFAFNPGRNLSVVYKLLF